MLETAELLRAAEWAASFKNIMFHNVLGIGLVVLGIVAAKSLKGGV
jgi:fluoride ion exporter CrcB/FEX